MRQVPNGTNKHKHGWTLGFWGVFHYHQDGSGVGVGEGAALLKTSSRRIKKGLTHRDMLGWGVREFRPFHHQPNQHSGPPHLLSSHGANHFTLRACVALKKGTLVVSTGQRAQGTLFNMVRWLQGLALASLWNWDTEILLLHSVWGSFCRQCEMSLETVGVSDEEEQGCLKKKKRSAAQYCFFRNE